MPLDTLEFRGCWNPMADEVLTIKEVAALLKLAEKTVYAMAQAGEIPGLQDSRTVAHRARSVDRCATARR